MSQARLTDHLLPPISQPHLTELLLHLQEVHLEVPQEVPQEVPREVPKEVPKEVLQEVLPGPLCPSFTWPVARWSPLQPGDLSSTPVSVRPAPAPVPAPSQVRNIRLSYVLTSSDI